MAVFKNSEDSSIGRYYVYRHIRLDTNMPFYIGHKNGSVLSAKIKNKTVCTHKHFKIEKIAK